MTTNSYSRYRGRQESVISSRGLLELTHFGYMWMIVGSQKIIASHTIYSMLEIEPFSEFLTADKWRSHIHPRDLYKLLQAEEQLFATRQPCTVEYRLITKKGKHIFVNHSMTWANSFNGESKIESIIDDVTEQKRADIILEVMGEAFFELDDKMVFRRVNAKLEFFWQTDRSAIIGKQLMDVFPAVRDSPFSRLVTIAKKENKAITQDVICPVTRRWLHLSVSPYTDGIVVVFYDIHNEKEADEKIRKREEEWRSLVENTPDMITRWNRDLKLVYANSAFGKKMNLPDNASYGKNSSEMGQPDEIALPWMESLQKVFTEGAAATHYNYFPSPEGPFYFQTRMIPEKDRKGKIESVLAIARDITELRKANHLIKESRDLVEEQAHFIRQITEMIPGIITLVEPESREIIYSNRKKSVADDPDHLYLPAGQVAKEIHPDDFLRLEEFYNFFVHNTGKNETAEVIYRIKDNHGGWQWFLQRGKVFERDPSGNVHSVINIIHNITANKRAEQELKESKDLLQLVFDVCSYSVAAYKIISSGGGIQDFEMLTCNKKAEEILQGIQTKKRFLSEAFPAAGGTGILEEFRIVAMTGEMADMEKNITIEGKHYWFRFIVKKQDSLLVVTVEDITPQKKAKEEIEKQNSILKQAEELAQIGSWEYNMSTGQFLWSDGMYRLFGLPKDTPVTPMIYVNYATPKDYALAHKISEDIKRNAERIEENLSIQTTSGIRNIRIKANRQQSDGEESDKILGVDMDITKTKQTEEEINALNRTLILRNRELASLHEELRAFTGIAVNSYSETLRQLYLHLEQIINRDGRSLSSSARASLRRSQAAVQKMKLVTDDLISFSRLQEIGPMEEDINPESILKSVLKQFEHYPGFLQIEINSGPLPLIKGYPFLIGQLFHHLIDNSVKFRKTEGKCVIDIACRQFINGISLDYPAAQKDLCYHVITIRDNGIGFPSSEAEKIFNMFYRLHGKGTYRGSGIGLAICKKIMDTHGGFIVAESLTSGAAFHCFFPVEVN